VKKIDLHTHTTASDGLLTPVELIDYAQSHGVHAMAITDHDTVDGLTEAIRHAGEIGFSLVPGIEFSIDFTDGSFHLLGLYIDHKNTPLVKALESLTEFRDRRIIAMVDDLKRHGVDISIEDVERESAGSSVGRPHVARALLKKGHGRNIKEIFQNFLVKGKPGYVKKQKIHLEEAVDLINGAGGIPIIAHPVSLNTPDYVEFEKILTGYIELGIRGIEVYASMHDEDQVREYLRIAGKYNLVITGGSDFHGDKDEIIGDYITGKPVPPGLYPALEACRTRFART